MPDKVLTASPEDPEPVVTPKPRLITQFGSPWGRILMRPTMVVDGGKGRDMTLDEQLKAPAEKTKEDRWAPSGCHATSVSMLVEWLRQHPKIGAGLALPYPPSGNESAASPQHIWKWIYDPGGTPDLDWTATSRPPWTPRHQVGNAWFVDHPGIRTAVRGIKRGEEALKLSLVDTWKSREEGAAADANERAARKKKLKAMLLQCGPLAINMTRPGHYVLLYGYRGNYMYILDPGASISKWALRHPNWPKNEKGKGVAASNVKLVDSATSQVIAQFFSTACDLVIDAECEFDFTNEKTKKTFKCAFIDTLINAEGYYFPSIGNFTEFLSAATPDGSSPPKPKLPPPPPSNGGSTGPSTPTTSTTAPTGTSAGGASTSSTPSPPPPEASMGGFFGELWDELIRKLKDAGTVITGPSSGDAGNGTNTPIGPPAPPKQVRASVTVIDDETEKPIAGVEVEIVGIDKGNTSAKGVWASKAFEQGTYNVKTRKAGYGPGGSDHSVSEGETAQSVAFASTQTLTIRMRDLSRARAFVWILEHRSRRVLAGIEAEIVGIDKGPSDSKGKWTSKAFAPAKKWVKTRAPGWGPAGDGAVEGETAQEIDFGKGDKTTVVYMSQSKPLTIPPPSGCSQDPTQLSVGGPAEIDGVSYAKTEQVLTYKADPMPGGVHPLAQWTLYDPSGNLVDKNHEPIGSTYDLPSEKVKACMTSRGNDAYGRWIVRFERGTYYCDYPFVLVGPMPDVGATATSDQPAPSAPPGDAPAGFVADGYNPDKITKVNAADMAQAYIDALKESGATPSRETVLILTAHWDFETGGGKAMHWFNVGNVKYVDKNGKVAYTAFRCDEWLNASELKALEKSTPEEQYEVTDKTRADKTRGTVTRVFLKPPHPGTRFRAYPNLSIGLAAHLKMIKDGKFKKAFEAAVAKDIAGFARELRAAKYYTDSEDVYRKGLRSRYDRLAKQLPDLKV